MQDRSLQHLGGVGAQLIALLFVCFALFVLLAPWTASAAGELSWLYVIADYTLALIGLLGLAVVPALRARLASYHEGWVHWTSALATLGFAVLAVTSFWQAEYETTQRLESLGLPALEYEEAPAPTFASPLSNAELAIQDLVTRTPRGWLDAALLGFWIFVVSWLARMHRLFPKGLVHLGLVTSILLFANALGGAFQLTLLHYAGLFLGMLVLTPFWFAWIGHVLLQVNRFQPASASLSAHPQPVLH